MIQPEETHQKRPLVANLGVPWRRCPPPPAGPPPPNQDLPLATPTLGQAVRGEWHLDPDFLTVNHGSFGATPRAVTAAQRDWQDRMERQPTRFMATVLPTALRGAADDLGRFVGAEGRDIVFLDNATTGCNAVLRAIALNRRRRSPGPQPRLWSHPQRRPPRHPASRRPHHRGSRHLPRPHRGRPVRRGHQAPSRRGPVSR